jgi:predicted secreted hydrolase
VRNRSRFAAGWLLLAVLTFAESRAAGLLDPLNAREATTFPRAHGAHPGSALEWWYLTGLLRDDKGNRLGFQVTFFRARVDARKTGSSSWRPGDLYFAHYAISDLSARYFHFDERIARTSVALAGADSTDLNVWIQDWSLRRGPDGTMHLEARSSVLGDLTLDLVPPKRNPVAWGPQYLSVKNTSGTSLSRYHSYPRLKVSGRVGAHGGLARPVRGTAWYDHEWTNGVYDPGLAGWDWFGLRLRDGRSVMLYRMRTPSGQTAYLFGGLVDQDGTVHPFGHDQVRMDILRSWTSKHTSARYPVAWLITIERPDEEKLELHVSALLSDQELDTAKSTRVAYWEGAVDGSADEGGVSTKLEGYMELTGYEGSGVPGRVAESGKR